MAKIHHICIQTDDYIKSLNFYVKILGFKLIKETKDFHTRLYNSWLESDGFMIELQTNKAGEKLSEYSKNSKGIAHFCLLVTDVELEYKRIKNLGYTDFRSKNGSDIYTVENGRLIKISAPEGTIIEIRDRDI